MKQCKDKLPHIKKYHQLASRSCKTYFKLIDCELGGVGNLQNSYAEVSTVNGND